MLTSVDGSVDPRKLEQKDFDCDRLPGAPHENPLARKKPEWVNAGVFTDEEQRVMYKPFAKELKDGYPVSEEKFMLKLAGVHRSLHFNPETTVIGMCTCGGVCPGLNNVIRALTLSASYGYNVQRVIGFKFGFWGLSAEGRHTAMDLTPEIVRPIHRHGGTSLGSSRGPQSIDEMIETLTIYKVNILFTIGGDGTQRGASKLADECRRRGLDIAVIGIPKTIDNDLTLSHRTFGYETAVEEACTAIRAAAAEAMSHQYGVGIVKVMGRHSGFIACQATISTGYVNICLVPEMPITQETFLKLMESRFNVAEYCVIVVAEGFGETWTESTGQLDASGNKILPDIGSVIKGVVNKFMKADKKKYKNGTVKFIDPSYMIRACPPSASDAAFCLNLSALAVHEAMAGYTNSVVTSWYQCFTLVPIKLATSFRQTVDLTGQLWRQVRETTVDIPKSHGRGKFDLKKNYERELRILSERRDFFLNKLSKL